QTNIKGCTPFFGCLPFIKTLSRYEAAPGFEGFHFPFLFTNSFHTYFIMSGTGPLILCIRRKQTPQCLTYLLFPLIVIKNDRNQKTRDNIKVKFIIIFSLKLYPKLLINPLFRIIKYKSITHKE